VHGVFKACFRQSIVYDLKKLHLLRAKKILKTVLFIVFFLRKSEAKWCPREKTTGQKRPE
jgi:hypothetical protein